MHCGDRLVCPIERQANFVASGRRRLDPAKVSRSWAVCAGNPRSDQAEGEEARHVFDKDFVSGHLPAAGRTHARTEHRRLANVSHSDASRPGQQRARLGRRAELSGPAGLQLGGPTDVVRCEIDRSAVRRGAGRLSVRGLPVCNANRLSGFWFWAARWTRSVLFLRRFASRARSAGRPRSRNKKSALTARQTRAARLQKRWLSRREVQARLAARGPDPGGSGPLCKIFGPRFGRAEQRSR